MSDMISREEAIDTLTNLTCYGIEEMENLCSASVADSEGWIGGILEAIHELQALPSAEPEQKKGKWVVHDYAFGRERYECTECRGRCDLEYNFCPNCGAEMMR